MANLSVSLNNALSGLSALSRLTETVSSNISNTLTDGYSAREVNLSQRITGGTGTGVYVASIDRRVDPVLLNDRRAAEGELRRSEVQVSFFTDIVNEIGTPDDPGSLTGRLATFSSYLIEAASRPDVEARLQTAVDAAKAITENFNALSDKVQAERLEVDTDIQQSVDFINTSLEQIAYLNGQIAASHSNQGGALAFLDQRQQLVDGIAELVPLREVSRDNGTIALFTEGGAIILDTYPAEFEFARTGIITPQLSVGAGSLSGLTINGLAVSTSVEKGAIKGGKLASLFDIRDVQAPAVQERLDGLARDLIERFEDPAVDPSLAAGMAGLFTDGGNAISATVGVTPSLEVGLSGRIAVNAAVDNDQGGEAWRLRAGIGAAGPGSPGEASLINALSDALNASRLPATGGFDIEQSAKGLAAEVLNGVSVNLTTAESRQSYAKGYTETLVSLELQNGVDTDAELQKLLLIEQSYAANARVIQTIDQLLQQILGI